LITRQKQKEVFLTGTGHPTLMNLTHCIQINLKIGDYVLHHLFSKKNMDNVKKENYWFPLILTYVVDNTAMLQLSSVLTAMWALQCGEVSHNFPHRPIFEEIHSCVHNMSLWIQFGHYISEIYYITDYMFPLQLQCFKGNINKCSIIKHMSLKL